MVKNKLITKTYFKEIINTIRKNRKRFLSLVCIIALGVGFYVGMKSASPDMKYTVSEFSKRTNFMDLKIMSEIGLTEEEINSIKNNISNADLVEGSYEVQLTTFIKENESVISVHSYNKDKIINNIEIIDGRLPENNSECLVEQDIITAGYKIGDVIKLNDNFKNQDVNIVGVIRSPLYISINKGTSLLLSGKINYYMYVPEDNFKFDYYTTAYIKGSYNGNNFGQEYYQYVDNIKTDVKKKSREISNQHLSNNLDLVKKEISRAEEEYNSQKKVYEAEIENASKSINDAEKQIEAGYASIKTDQQIDQYIYNLGEQLKIKKAELDKAKSELDALKAANNFNNSDYNQQITSLEKQKSELDSKIFNLEKEISYLKMQLLNYQTLSVSSPFWAKGYYGNLETQTQKRISELENQLSSSNEELKRVNNKIDVIKKSTSSNNNLNVQQAENKYNNFLQQYNSVLNSYNYAINNMKKDNKNTRDSLDLKKQELDNRKNDLEKKKNELDLELSKYKIKIDDAKDKLASLENSDWYVFTRNDNAGYSQYSDDVERVSNLAKIFPVIFFLVAALVTLTSLSRMIDEERTQIGTLKALGFRNSQLFAKYLSYAIFSTLIGSFIGIFVGSLIIPTVVFNVYQIMYILPDLILKFNLFDSLIGIIFALISTAGTAYLVCRSTLNENPARLMKPKAKKKSKKSIMECIPFIWNRISLKNKVIFRNLFVEKKRFFMTIFGVAGCVALIVSGFSLRHSVGGIVPTQYGGIFNMDAQIFYKDKIHRSEINSETERISKLDEVTDTLLSHIENVDIKSGNKTYNVNLVSPSDGESLTSMINIQEYSTGQKYDLDDNGVVITTKLAKLLNVDIGDEIEYMDNNGKYFKSNIANITENYVDHYIYMSPKYYEKIRDISPRNNMLLIKMKDGVNSNDLSKKISSNDKVSSITFVSIAKDAYKKIMNSLNMVVIVIIVSAILLAFMVLYNLVSINVSERKVDIATIKVLGFNKKEVNAYIKREMKILSCVGIIIGLLCSKYLASSVIRTCEVDNLMFNKKLQISCYVVSTIITLIFLFIVDKITNKEIRKVDMIDSLKILE